MRVIINTSYPSFQLYYKQPSIIINQELGTFNFEYLGPAVTIDQRQAMREIGLEDITYFIEKSATEAHQVALAGISRIAQEGDLIMNQMTSGGNTIALLAKENMFDSFPEVNVDAIPKTMPEIYTDYEIEVKWNEGKLDINFEIYPPLIKWYLGKVDVSVATGSKFDVRG